MNENVYSQKQLTKEEQRQYKEILIRTFKSFDEFCRKHNIKYFAVAGTVLGAVRHKGLIPWDDDIDVGMDRENYIKFLSLRNDSSIGHYEILDIQTPGYYLEYAKYCDASTTIWEQDCYNCILGIFIDVFPLDSVSDITDFITTNSEIKSLWRNYRYSLQPLKYIPSLKHPRVILQFLLSHLVQNNIFKKICVIEERLGTKRGNDIAFYATSLKPHKVIYPKTMFNDLIYVPYEDMQIPIPADYDNYLRKLYGDYMTPPSIEQQKSQHWHYFLDLNKRYTLEEIRKIKNNGK